MFNVLARSLPIALCAALIAAPAAAQIGGLLPSGGTASGCEAPGVDDRCEAWTATYHDPEISPDSSQSPSGIALSVDGSRLFYAVQNTTGTGFDSRSRWSILGYDPMTGEPLWESKWGAPDLYSFPTAIDTAPQGPVIVTGSTRTEFSDPDSTMITIALDPDTGRTLWEARFNNSAKTDNARSLEVSPDGSSVYVATITTAPEGDLDYALIGYDVLTGRELFSTTWNGMGKGDSPFGLALSPDGDIAYLTGWSGGPGEYNVDYGTVAIATTGPTMGQVLWTARYDGTGVSAPDQANAIDVSIDGSKVYVTGMSNEADASAPFAVNYRFATVAYDATTGAQLWDARTGFPGTNFNHPNGIAVDRNDRVFVTGQSKSQSPSDNDIATVAYDGLTGQTLWSERYGLAQHDLELTKAIAVAPNGDGVYVTGLSSSSQSRNLYAGQTQNGDQITIGYDPADGSHLFTARYNATGYDYDVGHDALVSPDGKWLFLSSALKHNVETDHNFHDAGLIAYEIDGTTPPPGNGGGGNDDDDDEDDDDDSEDDDSEDDSDSDDD